MSCTKISISRSSIQTCSYRCTTHIDLVQQDFITCNIEHLFFQIISKSRKFLSWRHRHSILKLCSTHLDRIFKFLSLITERRNEALQWYHQLLIHANDGIADSGRISIIGTLTTIDMIIRHTILILTLLMTQNLNSTVGNNFVSIHIHRSTGATLHQVDREILP